MLSEEQNRALTQVGADTPMGELLRRYWMPIAAVAELDDRPTKPVRLMGEDLVLYKDKAGTYGLVDRHCPHRRADLSYGWVEGCGLRCHYHGWLWEHTGRCLQQPFEAIAHPEAKFKDRVRIKAYPVEAKAGLLWAYLGPPPAPLVPTWEPFTWGNGFVQIVFSEVPCNWFQCQENSIDPVHFEWLHSNWSRALGGADGERSPAHLKVGFDEFEYGFVAWVGQGTVADRTQEHLGESDRGVIMMRRRILEDAERVARGEEPKGLIRDPEKNRVVRLPIIGRDFFVNGSAKVESETSRQR